MKTIHFHNKELDMNRIATIICLVGALPMAASAQQYGSTGFGPVEGEREFSLSRPELNRQLALNWRVCGDSNNLLRTGKSVLK